MSDVFISYASSDREIAAHFAAALTARGLSVWWDRDIQYGSAYARVIEHEVRQAACVMVLWSARSVASDWVCNEASIGMARGVLLPVTLEEGLVLPIAFSGLQVCAMERWDGDPGDPAFQALAAAVLGRRRGPTAAPVASPPTPPRRGSRLARLVALGAVAAPSIVVVAGVAFLAHDLHPTAVQLDLKVNAMTLRSGQETPVLLTEQLEVLELSLHGLGALTLFDGLLLPAVAGGSGVAGGGQALTATHQGLKLVSGGEHGASMSIAGVPDSAGAAARVDGLTVPGLARMAIALDSRAPATLRVRYDRVDRHWVMSLRSGAVVRFVDATAADAATNATWLSSSPAIVAAASADSPRLDAQGVASGSTLHAVLRRPEAAFRLEPLNLRLSELSLATLGPGGSTASSVAGGGSISFTDYLSKVPVAVAPGDFVALQPLERFFLRRIEWLPQERMLRIQAGGTVASIRSGPAGGIREHALSPLAAAWAGPSMPLFVALLLWLLATLAAWFWFVRRRRP